MVKIVNVIKEPFTGRDVLVGLTGVISYELVTRSYIHVGSGRSILGVSKDLANAVKRANILEDALRIFKLPQYREGVRFTCLELVRYGGKVCIPGSSIKGVVRSRLELLSSPINDRVESCFRVVDSPPMQVQPPQGSQGWRHARIWWDAPSQERVSTCNPLEGDYSLCVICDIFGAPGVASRVFFSNACSDKVEVETKVLDYGECLELIPPNKSFLGELSFTSLKPSELGLVLLGMGAGSDGTFKEILLGKSRYRIRRAREGSKLELGRVVFKLRSIKLRDYSLSEYLSNEPKLKEILSKCSRSNYSIICRDEVLNELISELVRKALTKFKTFSKADTFSEVRRKLELSG